MDFMILIGYPLDHLNNMPIKKNLTFHFLSPHNSSPISLSLSLSLSPSRYSSHGLRLSVDLSLLTLSGSLSPSLSLRQQRNALLLLTVTMKDMVITSFWWFQIRWDLTGSGEILPDLARSRRIYGFWWFQQVRPHRILMICWFLFYFFCCVGDFFVDAMLIFLLLLCWFFVVAVVICCCCCGEKIYPTHTHSPKLITRSDHLNGWSTPTKEVWGGSTLIKGNRWPRFQTPVITPCNPIQKPSKHSLNLVVQLTKHLLLQTHYTQLGILSPTWSFATIFTDIHGVNNASILP